MGGWLEDMVFESGTPFVPYLRGHGLPTIRCSVGLALRKAFQLTS